MKLALAILLCLIVWGASGCAIRRWENRLQRVEDALDTADRIKETSERIAK